MLHVVTEALCFMQTQTTCVLFVNADGLMKNIVLQPTTQPITCIIVLEDAWKKNSKYTFFFKFVDQVSLYMSMHLFQSTTSDIVTWPSFLL